MTEKLANYANNETPKNVIIGNSPWSLIGWAASKWGPWVFIACFWGYWMVRQDERSIQREEKADLIEDARSEKLLEAYMTSTAVQSKTAEALEGHSEALEDHTDAIRDLKDVAERAHDRR